MINLDFHGVVGEDFTAGATQLQLRQGGPVTCTINSGGGSAFEGAAIYALLAAHPDNVDVTVIGIAASAASLIAMAGNTITMRTGALMMVHDPSALTLGNSADHAKTVATLEKLSDSYARIYAGRSGKPMAEIRKMMREEVWLSPEEAVEQGLATATDNKRADVFASFDYKKYAKADQAFAGAGSARAAWAPIVKAFNKRSRIGWEQRDAPAAAEPVAASASQKTANPAWAAAIAAVNERNGYGR